MTSSMSAWYPLVRNRSDFSTRFGVSRNPSRAGSSPSSVSSRTISSCMRVLYCMACWTLAAAAMSQAASDPPARDADLLYANRESIADAEQAAAIWDRALTAHPDDFEAARKL